MSLVFENGILSSTAGGDNFLSKPLVVTGSVWWVSSITGSNANAGTQELPFATLAQAITSSTTNNGDVIILLSGHTETITSAISVSKAVAIYGVGSGSSAPNFIVNGNVDCIQMSAANSELNNIYFPAGTAANTSRVKIDAANVKVKGCTFLCGTNDTNTVLITLNGLYARVDSCSMTITASGPASGVLVQSASAAGVRISNSTFNGSASFNWTNGAIYSTFAHLSYNYDSITLTNRASIIHTAAAKGYVTNVVASNNSRISV